MHDMTNVHPLNAYSHDFEAVDFRGGSMADKIEAAHRHAWLCQKVLEMSSTQMAVDLPLLGREIGWPDIFGRLIDCFHEYAIDLRVIADGLETAAARMAVVRAAKPRRRRRKG